MKSTLLLVLSVMVALLTLNGCWEKDESPTEPTPDSDVAEARVDSANKLLQTALMRLINDVDVEEPNDVDLSGPYNAYLDALQADESHAGANFGAGILEIVMMTQDAEIQDYFSKAKDFLERDDFFVVEGAQSQSKPENGLELRLNKVGIPLGTPIAMARTLSRIEAAGDPTFTQLQDIFVTEIIPRMETAVTRLKKVATHPDFTFTVTPRMMGDPYEDPVELDLTEVYAAIASLEVQIAFLYQFSAYNLDFTDYTGEGMLDAFTQGSPFMALHDGGAQRMGAAGQAWVAAVNNLEAGITFLEGETDNQSDDLIRIDPSDGIAQGDLDSIKLYLPRVRRALTTSEVINFEISDGSREDIEISLAALFNTPIQDFKALLPPYSVSLETVGTGSDYFQRDSSIQASVQIDSAYYYLWSRTANYDDGVRTWYEEYKNFDVPEWESAWNDLEARLINKPNASLRFGFNDYLYSGQQNIQCYVNYSYEEPTKLRYAPRFTWDANSFEEWILPDPTFNGLLPGMTYADFKRIFEITGEGWQKSELLDIWGD